MSHEKFDALGTRRCKTCAAWHNPDGAEIGACVLGPGQLFLVAAPAPAAALLRSPDMPAMLPALQSSPIIKRGDDGCLQWRSRATVH